jgi:hypothetical protein
MRIASTLGIISLLAAGCSSSTPYSTGPSFISGTVAQDTFPSQVQSVQAVGLGGHIDEAAVDPASGAFHIQVTGHDHYHLLAVAQSGNARVVFPRASSRVDGAFVMESGNVDVDLGIVRFWKSGMTVKTLSSNSCSDAAGADTSMCTADGVGQQCHDGTPAGAASICSDLDLPIGYGSASTVLANDQNGPFAIPSESPACRVGGCESTPDDSTAPVPIPQ